MVVIIKTFSSISVFLFIVLYVDCVCTLFREQGCVIRKIRYSYGGLMFVS